MKKHLALLSFVCACSFLSAQEAPAPDAAPQPQKKQQVQKAQKRNGQNRVLQNRVKRIQENYSKIISRFDTDKNGKIDQKEKEAMEKTFAEAHEIFLLSLSYKAVKAVDVNGDMILSDEEMANAPEKLQELHEKNRKEAQERARQRKMKQKKMPRANK